MDSSALLQFERLIPDSVGMAMRAASSAEFLAWVQHSLLEYARKDSPLSSDPGLTRALAFAWARALWNGLPLDAAGRKIPRMLDPADDAKLSVWVEPEFRAVLPAIAGHSAAHLERPLAVRVGQHPTGGARQAVGWESGAAHGVD